MDPQALVVADDRTGAADTGNRFAVRGYATTVVGRSNDPDREVDAAVIARDLDSRYVAADEAARRVRAAVADADALVKYKRVVYNRGGPPAGARIDVWYSRYDTIESTISRPESPSFGHLGPHNLG